MPQFAPVLELSSLDGTNGFRMDAPAGAIELGTSAAFAGDINNDGFDDFIIGAPGDAFSSPPGKAYIVFGKASGFPASLNLAALNGTDGFRISGTAINDRTAFSASSAGDVNGDGIDDLLIGAPRFGNTPEVYVVFGKASGFAANLNLSALDGTNGFKITPPGTDNIGFAVSSAGDVNGDGIDDIAIAGGFAGLTTSSSYIVFGKAAPFSASFDLASLDGTNGFVFTSPLGRQITPDISDAGDLNGDGIGDVAFGAPTFGHCFVVFGTDSGFPTEIDSASLNGTNGFAITGVGVGSVAGNSVASAGDVNGDGFGDLIVGDRGADGGQINSGAAYVIFGSQAGFAANIDLSALDGTNGFKLSGRQLYDRAGDGVSSAGDINGDGFADIIVSAPGVDPNGFTSATHYVVFGKASGFAADILLTTLNGNNGFRIHGEFGTGIVTVPPPTGAGDLNGDGFDDIIIGDGETGGTSTTSGAGYVVYGHRAETAVILTGTEIGLTHNGGFGADVIDALGGNDTVIGWEGNDNLDGGDGNDTLDGGIGNDFMTGGKGDDIFIVGARFDGTAEATNEGIDLVRSSVTHALRVNVENLELTGSGNINGTGNTLANIITGNGGSNIMNGLSGGDTMAGLAGNDTYYVDSSADQISEALNAGIDIVRAGVNWTLEDNFESLYLTGGAIIGKGNALSNFIYGTAGTNDLDGGGAGDRLFGLDGDDTYRVDSAGDLVFESGGAGNDRVFSSVNHTLSANVERLALTGTANINGTGNSGANSVAGNSGNNFINGMAGTDSLSGGAGLDNFLFTATLGAGNIDFIFDFTSADDTFRLDDAVFAGLALGYLSAAAFHTGAGAADASDRIIYNSATGAVFFDADGAGGAAQVQFATVSTGLALVSSDFYVF